MRGLQAARCPTVTPLKPQSFYGVNLLHRKDLQWRKKGNKEKDIEYRMDFYYAVHLFSKLSTKKPSHIKSTLIATSRHLQHKQNTLQPKKQTFKLHSTTNNL